MPARRSAGPASKTSRPVLHLCTDTRQQSDAAQREQLIAVAGRCPVHRLLTKDVAIVTVPALPAEPDAPKDDPLRP